MKDGRNIKKHRNKPKNNKPNGGNKSKHKIIKRRRNKRKNRHIKENKM